MTSVLTPKLRLFVGLASRAAGRLGVLDTVSELAHGATVSRIHAQHESCTQCGAQIPLYALHCR